MEEEIITTKKKILVIDDDPVIVQGIQLVFELENYHVECMTTGERTYHVISATKPDLIILDIVLDKNDGREIVRHMKKNEKTAHIPIILISGVDDIEKHADDCGADDYLSKPFTVDELLGRAKQHLAKTL